MAPKKKMVQKKSALGKGLEALLQGATFLTEKSFASPLQVIAENQIQASSF